MLKVLRKSLIFALFCSVGCTSMELTEVNQKVGYAYVIMVMPDQDCRKIIGDKTLSKTEIVHKNAKICYYG